MEWFPNLISLRAIGGSMAGAGLTALLTLGPIPGDGHPARMGICRGMADLRASGTSGPADRGHGGKGHAGAGFFAARNRPPGSAR
jgi:hypothetical protein